MLQGRLKCGLKIQTILLCKLSVATIEQFISAHFQFNNAGQIVYITDAKLLNSSYIVYLSKCATAKSGGFHNEWLMPVPESGLARN